MGLNASTVTVTFEDVHGYQTTRSYEGRVAALTDAQAIALADGLQTLSQLSVVDLQVSRRLTGFVSTAAEANSSHAETASLKCKVEGGGFMTLKLPALKAAYTAGKSVVTTDAAIVAFLSNFDNGDGVAADEGNFFVSDGEKLSEAYVEAGSVEGKIDK